MPGALPIPSCAKAPGSEVRRGPLKGIEGYFVRLKNQSRLVISVNVLSQSVATEVDCQRRRADTLHSRLTQETPTGNSFPMYPNLKLQLWRSGIRQNRLAQMLGMDETMLSRIINGFREPNSQSQIEDRANSCRVTRHGYLKRPPRTRTSRSPTP